MWSGLAYISFIFPIELIDGNCCNRSCSDSRSTIFVFGKASVIRNVRRGGSRKRISRSSPGQPLTGVHRC